MALMTPVGIAGYTTGGLRPQTQISSNGVVSSSVGGFGYSPTGQLRPSPPPHSKPKKRSDPLFDGPGITAPDPRGPIAPNNSNIPKITPKNIKVVPGKPGKRPAWQDSDYNSQISAIQRALDLYKSNMGVQRTRAGSQYADSSRDMNQQKTRDLSDMENDFASRGIVTSGVYGTSVGDYNQEWGQQKEGLSKQYKDALSDITNNYTSYLNDIQTQKEQARLDAIRRRAQQLELNPPKKGKGKAKLADDSRSFYTGDPKKKAKLTNASSSYYA